MAVLEKAANTVELFIRLTVLIALGLAAIFVLAFVLKIVFVAAILAGIGLAGLFIYSLVRRAARPGAIARR